MAFGRGASVTLAVAFLCCVWCVRGQAEAVYQLGNVDATSTATGGTAALRRQAGDCIQLACRGSTPDLDWTYPAVASKLTPTSSSYVSLEWLETEGEWSSTLVIANATHTNTGLYACARRNNSTTPVAATDSAIGAHERRLSIYVFVSDPVNLFQRTGRAGDLNVLVGVTGRTLVLPCAVNSPDTIVKLYRAAGHSGRTLLADWTSDEQGGSVGVLAAASPRLNGLQYDPRVGITMEIASLRVAGTYFCRAERGNASQERRVILLVIIGSQAAMTQPWMSSRSGFAYAQGSTIDLRCTMLIIKGNPVSVTWMKENSTIVNLADQRVTITPAAMEHPCARELANCTSMRHAQQLNVTLSAYKVVTSGLMISQAVQSDSGTYQCTASSVGISKSVAQEVLVSTAIDSQDDGNSGDNESTQLVDF